MGAIRRENNAGIAALDDEKSSQAIAHFDRAIALLQRPDLPALGEEKELAYQGRAYAHYDAEHWKLAVSDFNQYLALKPNDAEALSVRGVARKATGDYDGLMADEVAAARIDPQYQYLVDAAESTILRRRGFLALWIIGCLMIAAAVVPFVKAILHVSRLESEARRQKV